MKKVFISFLIIMSCILFACDEKKIDYCEVHIDENGDDLCDICNLIIEKKEINLDTTAPLFLDAQNGKLPTIKILNTDNIDLLDGIRVVDDSGNEVEVLIENYDLINLTVPGTYEVTYQAIDESGNVSTAVREVIVQKMTTISYEALVINDNGYEYVLNNETALIYTSSGAKFRMLDQIQVMDKEFFVSQYNENKAAYVKNGGEIFFPYGALVIFDLEGNFKLLRASSSPIQIDCDGNLTTNAFVASQSSSGEGMFKGIVEMLDSLIPDGGYIIFAPNRDDSLAKTFIIKNLFNSQYSGGVISGSDYNMKVQEAVIRLDDNFTKEVIDTTTSIEVMGKVNKTEYIYDGIPLATYNYGDGIKKPVLFFFHGFGGDHSSSIMDKGDELAKKGFFVVAIDAYLHGKRSPEFFQDLSYGLKQREIVNIQIQTAKDAMHLYHKYFKNDPRVLPGNVYAFGVSMGAGSAFYLATIMDEIKAIASIVGSPSFVSFYEEKQQFYNWEKDSYYYTNLESYETEDPLLNYEKLNDVYIYMGNGTLDTTVPKKYAEELTTKLDVKYYVYEEYNVAHTSTSEMLKNAYDYLVSHKN